MSSRMIASGASSFAASSSAEPIHCALAGSTVPENSIDGTVSDDCAPAPPANSASDAAMISQSQTRARRAICGLSAPGGSERGAQLAYLSMSARS